MQPEQHKNAITDAMLRCCRAYGTAASAGAIAGFEVALNELLKLHKACIAHNEMFAAMLQSASSGAATPGLLTNAGEGCPNCEHLHSFARRVLGQNTVEHRCALCGELVKTETDPEDRK